MAKKKHTDPKKILSNKDYIALLNSFKKRENYKPLNKENQSENENLKDKANLEGFIHNLQSEFDYFNPKVEKGITSGDKRIDLLYKNQWLLDLPILKNYIKKNAEILASRSGLGRSDDINKDLKRSKEQNLPYRGAHEVDLVGQFFDGDKLSPSIYKPTSDFLEFLPTYSIKGKDFIEDKWKSGGKSARDKEVVKYLNQLLTNATYEQPYLNGVRKDKDMIYEDFTKNKKTIYIKNSPSASKIPGGSADLTSYKTGIAWDKDKNLPYFSIADAWDFDPEGYSKNWSGGDERNRQVRKIQGTLMQKVGKPFKVYDRYYFDPKTKKYIPDDKVVNYKREEKSTKFADGGSTEPQQKTQSMDEYKLLQEFYKATGQNPKNFNKLKDFMRTLSEAESYSGKRKSSKKSSAKGYYHFLDSAVPTAQQRIKNILKKKGIKSKKFDSVLSKSIDKMSLDEQSVLTLANLMESPTAPYNAWSEGKATNEELYYKGHHTSDEDSVSSQDKVYENWNNAVTRLKANKKGNGGSTEPGKAYATARNKQDAILEYIHALKYEKDFVRGNLKELSNLVVNPKLFLKDFIDYGRGVPTSEQKKYNKAVKYNDSLATNYKSNKFDGGGIAPDINPGTGAVPPNVKSGLFGNIDPLTIGASVLSGLVGNKGSGNRDFDSTMDTISGVTGLLPGAGWMVSAGAQLLKPLVGVIGKDSAAQKSANTYRENKAFDNRLMAKYMPQLQQNNKNLYASTVGINNVAADGGAYTTDGDSLPNPELTIGGTQTIGIGGTHEQNTQEGITINATEDGTPNKAEEGEFILEVKDGGKAHKLVFTNRF
jgi:hypothetical protein